MVRHLPILESVSPSLEEYEVLLDPNRYVRFLLPAEVRHHTSYMSYQISKYI